MNQKISRRSALRKVTGGTVAMAAAGSLSHRLQAVEEASAPGAISEGEPSLACGLTVEKNFGVSWKSSMVVVDWAIARDDTSPVPRLLISAASLSRSNVPKAPTPRRRYPL